MEQSGNPAFAEKIVQNLDHTSASAMTRGGTYAKTGLLLLLAIASGLVTARSITAANFATIPWFVPLGVAVVTLIIGLVISFKPSSSPLLSPIYAVLQGALLGSISAAYAAAYDGVVGQAIVATIGAFIVIYLGYASGVLRATPRFTKIIIVGIVGTLLIGVVDWLISLFTGGTSLYLSSSNWGIGFSVVVVAIAALSLVLDFDFIERASQERLPKYFEWYGAFGLLVGLLWLYLELLRLFGKLAARQ